MKCGVICIDTRQLLIKDGAINRCRFMAEIPVMQVESTGVAVLTGQCESRGYLEQLVAQTSLEKTGNHAIVTEQDEEGIWL